MQEEEKKEQLDDEADETVTEADESVDVAATAIDKSGNTKPSAMMMGFQKVQAGRDVSKDQPSERQITEIDKESAIMSGTDGEVVSLNIKNTSTINSN